jgi:hypothetical protein
MLKVATPEERQRAAERLAFLHFMERRGHVYSGTVPAYVKAKRRAKNRVARASRRANRKG